MKVCALENTSAVHGRDAGSHGVTLTAATVSPDRIRKAWEQHRSQPEYPRDLCIQQLLENRSSQTREATIWSRVDWVEGKHEELRPIGNSIANTVLGVVDFHWPPVIDCAEVDGLNIAKA